MSKLPYLTKNEKKALEEFERKITQKLAGEVLELKLFGSKARGDFKKAPDSDIDILLVLKSVSKKKEDFIVDLTVQILLKYGVDISPHIYSQQEYSYLNNLPSIFMQILQRESVSLL